MTSLRSRLNLVAECHGAVDRVNGVALAGSEAPDRADHRVGEAAEGLAEPGDVLRLARRL
jgi:hypothetical protein